MLSPHEQQAIGFLRGEDNPFDAIVVPDRPGMHVLEVHVPAVHNEEYDRLCRILDKYRQPDHQNPGQPRGTRLVTVRGVRGSGKTHLMHVLSRRDTETPELWIRPRYFDPAYAFPEYILHELVRSLLSRENAESAARLMWCASAITRRVLYEAVAPLSRVEWCEWTRAVSPEGAARQPSRRGWSSNRERFLELLATENSPDPLPDVCRLHAMPVAAARALFADHVGRTLTGSTSGVRMKRETLLAFADLALLGQIDRLGELLEHDFTVGDESLPPSRPEIVLSLLETLVELLSAVRVPIVFAFDNVERLLAPRGSIDFAAAQSFFSGMAHLMDQTRGILMLLFVETGLWNQLTSAIDNFAEYRIRQGVRVKDYGCIWSLDLKSPTAEQIDQIVRQRMAPILNRTPQEWQLRTDFPFGPDDARNIAAGNIDVLRTVLLRLRDRYDEIVLPGDQHVVPGSGPAVERPESPVRGEFRTDWEAATADGRKRLQALRRTALALELHTGLARWLETLVGYETSRWRLKGIAPAVSYGRHPSFGLVTIAEWQGHSGRLCRVAIGPVLGEGRSMPKDLEVKLALFAERPAVAEQLLVLWPVSQGTIGVEQLPPATQQVWNQGVAGRDVFLRSLPMADFAWLISFPEWQATHLANGNADALKDFVRQQTAHFLEDCAPKAEVEVLS
jgi:hypothetical protein